MSALNLGLGVSALLGQPSRPRGAMRTMRQEGPFEAPSGQPGGTFIFGLLVQWGRPFDGEQGVGVWVAVSRPVGEEKLACRPLYMVN